MWMVNCLTWIRKALEEDGQPSSKRWLGCIILLVSTIVWCYDVIETGFDDHNETFGEVLICCGAGLVGLGTIGNTIKSFSGKKEEQP